MIIGLSSLLPGLGVSIRRNHDLNLSGWFILLGLIPFVNIAYVIYIFGARGTVGPNNYGEDPTDTPLGYAGPKLPTSVSQINSTQVNQ